MTHSLLFFNFVMSIQMSHVFFLFFKLSRNDIFIFLLHFIHLRLLLLFKHFFIIVVFKDLKQKKSFNHLHHLIIKRTITHAYLMHLNWVVVILFILFLPIFKILFVDYSFIHSFVGKNVKYLLCEDRIIEALHSLLLPFNNMKESEIPSFLYDLLDVLPSFPQVLQKYCESPYKTVYQPASTLLSYLFQYCIYYYFHYIM